MPTYDYECAGCGHEFEAIQSISGDRLKKCPKCGKMKLHRLIGAGSGIIFKGTGFYEIDYKRKGEPASSSKGSDKESKPKPVAKPAKSGGHGCSPNCGCAA